MMILCTYVCMHVLRYFFWACVARFSIGSERRAASRLFKLQTVKTQPRSPKDTARTLKIQRAACYSRVSGYVSAHLARVKRRSWQRVARIRIYMGKLTQGWVNASAGRWEPGRTCPKIPCRIFPAVGILDSRVSYPVYSNQASHQMRKGTKRLQRLLL